MTPLRVLPLLLLLAPGAPRAQPAAAAPAAQCPVPAPRARPAGPAPLGCYDRGTDAGMARCLAPRPLCARDREMARVAWKYFENNYNPKTGLINAADGYPSTTMWDAGSALAATMAAHRLGLITRKQFDDRVTAMLGTLRTLRLYRDEAPNKAYDASTAELTDYANQPVQEGLGYSVLDLARLATWLRQLECQHPEHGHQARAVLQRWSYCRMVKDGQLYGAAYDAGGRRDTGVQEGRLGYEQYGGKAFDRLGFDARVARSYANPFATEVEVEGVRVPVDRRGPRELGAYNYVVTESYALDALEFGLSPAERPLLERIFEVQRRRWQRTGFPTAVSEDNVDRPPHFIYNTIYVDGRPWSAITDQGREHPELRTVSTKAALSLATLFPDHPYAAVLFDAVRSAYDPERGWYSGVYEGGLGYNRIITANTNGIVLELLLYKALGGQPFAAHCQRCGSTRPLAFGADPELARTHCLPGAETAAPGAAP